MRKVRTRGRPRLAVAAGAALLAAGVAPLAHAVSFQGESGNWTLSWDTTVGYGQGWRLSRPDCRLIAIANGGCGYSPNIDDGDLNYLQKATFTEALTGVTELSLNYRDKAGVFVRGSGLYDFMVMDNNTAHVPLTHDAKGVIGSYTRLLDAFGFYRFTLGGPLIGDFQTIPRRADHKPLQSGQFGVDFKLYLPNFGQGTQLGLYFLNYTSRLPVVSLATGTQAGLGNAWGAASAVGAAAQALAAGLPFAAAVATGAAVGQQRTAAQGGNLSAATAQQ